MDNVRKDLMAALKGKTQSEVAREIGISPQLLCDILAKRREYGPTLLRHFKYRRIVTYVPTR